MMSFLQWRRFNFFDKDLVKEPGSHEVSEKLKGIDLSAAASGRGQLIFGDYEGNLHILDQDLKKTSFKAYFLRVTHLYQLKQHNLLISIGDDDEGIHPLLKVWNFDKIDRSGNPTCTRIVRAVPGNNPSQVTCLSAHENLNFMAIGFQNGSILLFKGDITKDRHSKSRILLEATSSITGLAFKAHPMPKTVTLFVSTQKETLSYHLMPKERDVKVLLDQKGCELQCSVVSDIQQEHQFVVGRRDAVYFYQPDERGPCLAFEGDKVQLHWYRGYLVVVSTETKPAALLGTLPDHSTDLCLVTVYDIQNKLITYSGPCARVLTILSDWGSLYIVCKDGKLFILQEKDTQTKLEILFKKNLYQLAIELAQTQQYDHDGIVDIFRQYGDHLYSKGDHDGAIQQYIKTIGKLEASYVIRKFLDAQRIHNLTSYLQALHKAQLATEDHTTLLLNCYTKLKDVAKLDEFIMTKNGDIDFDIETAIRVCRQAGYYKHALFLAQRHNQHDWYLKIQLEDIKDYTNALKYIAKLSCIEAEHNLKTYGKVLMTEVPTETTQLLKKLCTNYNPTEGESRGIQHASPDEFIHIFVNNRDNHENLTEFLKHMVSVQPNSSALVYNTLVELYLQECSQETDISMKVEKERRTLELLQNPEAHYDLDQALVLSQMHNFKAGILYLYEKAKLYQQIVQYHMDHNEYVHIIETCKRFGQQHPNLWIQALAYFARKEENCKQQMVEVLTHVEERNLLPPLLVVQTLAHNSTATLAVIKEYIVRRLQQENDQVDDDGRLIQQYRDETSHMRAEIEKLKNSAKIFQVSKCNICSHPLDPPSIHFLCQHSFHQHCFESYAEHEADCPVCLPENRKVLDIIRAQEQTRDLHEQFSHQLERSQDGFSVVADYFGRGVFNKVMLVTDRTTTRPSPRQPPRPPPRAT